MRFCPPHNRSIQIPIFAALMLLPLVAFADPDLSYAERTEIDLVEIASGYLREERSAPPQDLEVLQGLTHREGGGLAVPILWDKTPPQVLVLDRKDRPQGLVPQAGSLFIRDGESLIFLTRGRRDPRGGFTLRTEFLDDRQTEIHPVVLGSPAEPAPAFGMRCFVEGPDDRLAMLLEGAEVGKILVVCDRNGMPELSLDLSSDHLDGPRSIGFVDEGIWTMKADGTMRERLFDGSFLDPRRVIDSALEEKELAFPEIGHFKGFVPAGKESFLTLFSLQGTDSTGRPRLGAARIDLDGRLIQLGEVRPGPEWERGDTLRDWTADEDGRLYLLLGDSGVLRIFEPPKSFKRR